MDSLSHQGYTNIVFEPDGNIPPDILIDDRIAIEVRRLNENLVEDDGFRGLEQDSFTLHGLLTRTMRHLSDKDHDKSAFVRYQFSRPLPNKRTIQRKFAEILNNHKTRMSSTEEYSIDDSIQITIFPSSSKLAQQFHYGLSSDGDSGGLVVGLIHENLNLIAREKELKISKVKSRYPEWWLAVVDTIGYGLTDLDLEQFYNLPKIECGFDRILMVSPLESSLYTFLYE